MSSYILRRFLTELGEALWATLKEYNINVFIMQDIENLYNRVKSVVFFSGRTDSELLLGAARHHFSLRR